MSSAIAIVQKSTAVHARKFGFGLRSFGKLSVSLDGMETAGLIGAIVIVIALAIWFAVGRGVRKANLSTPSAAGSKGARAVFSKRGH